MEKIKFKVRKDDLVKVVAGKEKGKTGKVLKVDPIKGRVIITGLNMVKKAKKPRKQSEKGGIVEIEAPIDISNVMIMCKKCGPVRAGYDIAGGSKVRKCKKCGEVL